jgi:hypothetical protein
MAAELIQEAEAAGIANRTLQRAFKKMGGVSSKLSLGTGWIWELPQQNDPPPKLDA